MQEGDGFSAKPLGKSLFHGQNDWSCHGPAGQFCLLESALCWLTLSKSDQHQFSPHNVNTLAKVKVMRFNKMITSGKMRQSFIKFPELIL